MKINQFKFNNYHNISTFEYEPKEKVTFLIGDNGSGKSSFIQSIGYLFTGNEKDPTKSGQAASQVSATLESGTKLSRAKKEGKTLLGVDNAIVPEKHFKDVISKEIGQIPENLTLVTSSDIANNLNPVDFGNMLLKFIPQDITAEDIISYCKDMTPERRVLLTDALGKFENINIVTIRKICEFFTDIRKGLKRDCTALEKQSLLYRQTPCDISPDEIEEMLKKCAEKSVLFKKYVADKKAYDAAIKTKAETEKKIAEIDAFLETVKDVTFNEEDYEKLIKDIQSFEATLKDTEISIIKTEEDIKSLESIIENLNSNVCPIHKDIKCSTDKSSVKNSLMTVLNNQKENLEKMNKALSNLKEEIAGKNEQKKALEEKRLLSEKKKNSIETRESLAKILKELIIPSMPEEIDEELLKKETQFAEAKKKESDSYKAFVDSQAKIAATKTSIVNYDSLVKSLSEKGEVIESIMSKYVSIISDACERTCEKLCNAGRNYEIKFVADRGIQCYVKIGENDFLPVEKLSTGEKIVVSVIISDMLNQLTGFNIMVIDNTESLDKNALTALADIIDDTEIADMYDHIFISSVSENITDYFKDKTSYETVSIQKSE